MTGAAGLFQIRDMLFVPHQPFCRCDIACPRRFMRQDDRLAQGVDDLRNLDLAFF